MIVSNPPFFVDSLKSESQRRNLARHSDSLPFGELVHSVTSLLNKDGKFVIILPVNESNLFSEIAFNFGLYCNKKTNILPKRVINCNRIISEYQLFKSTFESSSIVLRNNDDTYTKEYIELTRDFYINF